MRFEKVSFEQFVLDYTKIFYYDSQISLDLNEYLKITYDNIKIPTRGTKYSAGYDFSTPIAFSLEPGGRIRIPSGIRVILDEDKVLTMYPRSSTGMKGLNLTNSTGVVDSDYSFAKNEGHIMFDFVNNGNNNLLFDEGERVVQGIILSYYTVNEEEVGTVRVGGIGSTGQ